MVLGLVALAIVGTLADWPLIGEGQPLLLVANVLVSLGFLTAAEFVGAEPGHHRTGVYLALVALVWPLNWLNEWNRGPFPLIAEALGPLASLIAGWALLRYPAPLVNRRMKLTILGWFAILQLASFLVVVLSRPGWHQFADNAWWVSIWPSRGAAGLVSNFVAVANAVTAVVVAALFAARVARLPVLDRRAMRPVAVSAASGAVLTVVANATYALLASDPVADALYTVQAFVFLAIPVSLVFAVVHRWAVPERLELMPRLRNAMGWGQVQDTLREALADPTLRILFHSGQSYVDTSGAEVPAPDPHADRVVVEIRHPDSDSRIAIVADGALRRYSALVSATVYAIELFLRNGHLRSTVPTLSASTRLHIRVDAERHRLGRDLEHAVRRRLSVVDERLAGIVADEPLADAIKDARNELRLALDELHALAHGEHPGLLSAGLMAAVLSAAKGILTPVRIHLPRQRFEPEVETCAYYLIAELLANAGKHARARHIEVSGKVSGNDLHIEVADDGIGGADPNGHGLRGVATRVRAAGGDVYISSTDDGTCVKARIPLPRKGS